MVRYTQRAWFHPIGFMSQSLPSYPVMVLLSGVFVFYPLRYSVADYWERCQQDQGTVLKTKATLFYQELEAVGKRQAFHFNPMRDDSGSQDKGTVFSEYTAFREGHLDTDYEYFRVHAKDVARMKEIVGEIKELRTKMATAE